MNFLEIAKSRCSVRSYQNRKVEQDKLNLILEAARVAPTAANLQPVRLIVAENSNDLSRVSDGANIYGAPLAIIICADHSIAWTRPFDEKKTTDIDASIVTDHMMLQATELGLGSVWICYFKPEIIKHNFNLPNNLEPINILAVGYSNQAPANANRHISDRNKLDKLVYSTKDFCK